MPFAQIRPARLVTLIAVLVFAAAPLAAHAADACSLLSKEQISAVANDPIANASGVGDDAFFTPSNDPKPTLFAFKGGHFITVRLNVSGFTPEQTRAALKTLANDALGKF